MFNPEAERWRVVGDLSSPRRGLTLTVGNLVMIRRVSFCVLQVVGPHSSGTTGSLQFDPKVKQCCSKLINPFERHLLPSFENSSTTCCVVADCRWWSCYGSGRQVLHIKYSCSSFPPEPTCIDWFLLPPVFAQSSTYRFSTAIADADIFDPEMETWTVREPFKNVLADFVR